MMSAIRDRIAYERSYSIGERWERAKERAARFIAYRLPARVRAWVIIHRHAEVTNGTDHPDTVKAFDLSDGLMPRWRPVHRHWKWVGRYDPRWPKFRLFRVAWNVGMVGDGKGYSRKVSVALRPRLFRLHRTSDSFRLVMLGIEVHSATSYGGRFV